MCSLCRGEESREIMAERGGEGDRNAIVRIANKPKPCLPFQSEVHSGCM